MEDGALQVESVQTASRARKPRMERLSRALIRIGREATGERITIGDLLAALQGRAFGALMFVFAAPNMLPSPPGLAGVLGLPLLVLSTLLMMGRDPWLPDFIARRSIATEAYRSMVERATPWIRRAERLLRHRLDLFTSAPAQRLIGGLILFVTIVLLIPVPFGNLLPSFAITVLALGLLGRDGVWIIGGIFASVVATAWVGVLGYALVKSAIFVVLNAF